MALPLDFATAKMELKNDIPLFEEEAKKLDIDLECPICFEINLDPYRIQVCRHLFCKACLDQLNNPTCPMCRREFKEKEIFADTLQQQTILNIWKRCKEDKDKAKANSIQRLPLGFDSAKRIALLRDEHSKLPEDSLASTMRELCLRESSDLTKVSLPKISNEQLLLVQDRLKYDKMVQCIFSEIAEDQSTMTSQYTLKTTWTSDQNIKIDNLRECWQTMHATNYLILNDYLSALEKIIYSLASIMKQQLSSLHLSDNAKGQNVTTKMQSGGTTITRSAHGGCKIVIQSGGLDSSFELLKMYRASQNENFSFHSKDVHTYINDREVKRSDANFIRALTQLDALLLECFSLRYQRQEFSKAFSILTKISSESAEKQTNGLITLSEYCNNLILSDNLAELLLLFKEHAQEENGIDLLGRIYENLISLGPNNRETIQIIMASLDDSSIQTFKNAIIKSVEMDEFNENSLQLLYLCDDYKLWCLDQTYAAAQNCLEKKQIEMAQRLIEKYLLKNSATEFKALALIRKVVNNFIADNYEDSACKFIDKFFINRPGLRQEGLDYVCKLIEYKVQNNYEGSACKLIEKYLFNEPETYSKGMAYISRLIEYRVQNNYEGSACKLIEKYLLNKPETYNKGMAHISRLIEYRVQNNYEGSACKLIKKYLLNKPETYKEGLAYIHRLIEYKVRNNYEDSACKLIEKYLLNKPETYKEGLAYIHRLIEYKIRNNYEDKACKLIEKYLLNKPETKEIGMSYIKQMINNAFSRGNTTTAAKLKNKYTID